MLSVHGRSGPEKSWTVPSLVYEDVQPWRCTHEVVFDLYLIICKQRVLKNSALFVCRTLPNEDWWFGSNEGEK